MAVTLSQAQLAGIDNVAKPQYSREAVTPGIVHLGIGAFHRAHQAIYNESLLNSGDLRWGTIAASLRSTSVHDALAPQDFLYSVCEQQADQRNIRIVGGVLDVCCASQSVGLQKLLAAIANPQVHVLTLTVTEKGYLFDEVGALDVDSSAVAHDLTRGLARQGEYRSAPGIIAAGLAARRSTGAPLTILSCDNLTSNGAVTRRVVRDMAQAWDADLARWIDDNVSFPSTMVDRIVPQTKPQDIALLAQQKGYTDNALVVCEPFRQWVIEDKFAGVRPPWDEAGAQFVKDVAPFEQAKLRLLNASHSMFAYLGLLLGFEFIHEAVADEQLRVFVRGIVDNEIASLVQAPAGFKTAAYVDSVFVRFANQAVPYRTAQVASDGSLKLPQRIYPTLNARARGGLACDGLLVVVAAWLHCLGGSSEIGNRAGEIGDPAAQKMRELTARHTDSTALVTTIRNDTGYWIGLADVPQSTFTALSQILSTLRNHGLRTLISGASV